MQTHPMDSSATEMVRAVRAGDVSVLDLMSRCLDRIRETDPTLHAWAYFNPEIAMRQARQIDTKLRDQQPVGLLCGIPVGVKDIFNTADMPTQMGSPIWSGYCPGNDARVVHYLRMADGIIPGKTVTAEFAVHTPGPTLNPHNREFMAGTSSTGSAVAVASRMVPLAIGTQTAGSTIRPASYVGIYGFKPSFGLLPRTGMLKTTDSLDTVGLFARFACDLKLLFDILRVHGPDYPISHALLSDRQRQTKGSRRWRVAVIKGPKWDCAETYAKTSLLDFARRLASLGDVEIADVKEPRGLAVAHEIHATIYDRTLAYYFKDEFRKHTLVSPTMYEIIRRGNQLTLDQYRAALQSQTDIAFEMDQFLDTQCDIVLTLSTGGEALRGLTASDRPDNCLIWTLCGLPAINLPVFTGPLGLPFGAQVVARRYNDYLLLSFAEFLVERGLVPDVIMPASAV